MYILPMFQVQCEKDLMRVRVVFDRPFYGMVFSKGFYRWQLSPSSSTSSTSTSTSWLFAATSTACMSRLASDKPKPHLTLPWARSVLVDHKYKYTIKIYNIQMPKPPLTLPWASPPCLHAIFVATLENLEINSEWMRPCARAWVTFPPRKPEWQCHQAGSAWRLEIHTSFTEKKTWFQFCKFSMSAGFSLNSAIPGAIKILLFILPHNYFSHFFKEALQLSWSSQLLQLRFFPGAFSSSS